MSKADIRRTAGDIAVTAYLDARDYLAEVYRVLKERTPSYSYVRFTEDMGFGACNAMHLIIHGQRPLTPKGADKIVDALGLTGVDRRYFESLVKASRAKTQGRDAEFDKLASIKAEALPTELDRRQLEFFNDWHHSVILELLGLPDASDDPEWLAAALQPALTALKVKKSLALLKKLGYIVHDKTRRRWVPSQSTLSTGNEVYGMAIVRYHRQMIEMAKAAVTDVPPMERDISTVTLAFPHARLDELKQRIQAFRQELLALAEGVEGADEIVQVNLQMFPVGRGTGARSKK